MPCFVTISSRNRSTALAAFLVSLTLALAAVLPVTGYAVEGANPPAAPSYICIEDGGDCPPPRDIGGGAMKWNPGVYIRYGGANSSFLASSFHKVMDEISEMPNVRGLKVHVFWGNLEGSTPGDYRFKELRDLYEYLRQRDLRMALHVQTRRFSDSCASVVPEYLQNNIGRALNSKGNTCVAKLWNSDVMGRYVALLRALADEFESKSHFEAIMFTETAVSAPYDDEHNYSAANFIMQMKRAIDAAGEAFPTTNKAIYFNYISNSSLAQRIDLYRYMFENEIAAGGPDQHPPGPGLAEGDTASETAGMLIRRGHPDHGGVDYRWDEQGNLRQAAIMDTQPPQMGGRTGNFSARELTNHAWHLNGVTHFFVTYKEHQANPVTNHSDCANWSPNDSSIPECAIGFKAFIEKGLAIVPARNSKCPANYSRGCQ